MKEKRYLRIDCNKENDFVTINGNKEGLEYLRDCIESLLNISSSENLPEDVMLMIPEWGGTGLTKDDTFDGDKLVGALKIYRWE